MISHKNLTPAQLQSLSKAIWSACPRCDRLRPLSDPCLCLEPPAHGLPILLIGFAWGLCVGIGLMLLRWLW